MSLFSRSVFRSSSRHEVIDGSKCLEKGNDALEESFAKASEYYRRGAEEFDHGPCQYALGTLYVQGRIGLAYNLELAAYWFKRAIGNNVKEYNASFTLGVIYLFGAEDVAINEVEALKWIKMAAKIDPSCYTTIGDVFFEGVVSFWDEDKSSRRLVEKDYEKAIAWYLKAVAVTSREDGPATKIAEIYLTGGHGLKKDYTKSLFWTEKYWKGRKRPTECDRIILKVYREGGYGVEKDIEKALNLCLENEDPSFYFDAAEIYQFYIYPPDYVNAAKYYYKTPDSDSHYHDSKHRLGYLYSKGLGVKKDLNYAKSFLLSGNYPYYKGYVSVHLITSEQTDFSTARNHFRRYRSGDKLYGKAMNQLGLLYQQESAYKEANAYFKIAAADGCHDAYNSLGDIYRMGYGVDVDYEEAFKWYSKAAEEPMDNGGQFNLGMMYSEGKGTKVNHKLAFYWFERAHHYGDERVSAFIIGQIKLLAELSEKIAVLEAQLENTRSVKESPKEEIIQMFSV